LFIYLDASILPDKNKKKQKLEMIICKTNRFNESIASINPMKTARLERRKARRCNYKREKERIAQPVEYHDICALQQQLVGSSPEMGSEQREKALIITYRYARKIAAPDLPRRNDAVDSRDDARIRGKKASSLSGTKRERERERGKTGTKWGKEELFSQQRQQQRATARSVIKSSRFPFISKHMYARAHVCEYVCTYLYVRVGEHRFTPSMCFRCVSQ
jgi:hypothetical protein